MKSIYRGLFRICACGRTAKDFFFVIDFSEFVPAAELLAGSEELSLFARPPPLVACQMAPVCVCVYVHIYLVVNDLLEVECVCVCVCV
jgi:hypothetical protein